MSEVLLINKESVAAVKDLLPLGKEVAIERVERMLEIKRALLWRAEAGTCCDRGNFDFACFLGAEVDLLEKTLAALEKGDIVEAGKWLDTYLSML